MERVPTWAPITAARIHPTKAVNSRRLPDAGGIVASVNVKAMAMAAPNTAPHVSVLSSQDPAFPVPLPIGAVAFLVQLLAGGELDVSAQPVAVRDVLTWQHRQYAIPECVDVFHAG